MRHIRTTVNDVCAPCGISSPYSKQAVNSIPKPCFQMELYVKMYLIFTFFLVLNHDFVTYVTHIAASNTATDDLRNYVVCRIFNTNL